MKIDHCPVCKRNMDLRCEPSFDTKRDSHIGRCHKNEMRYDTALTLDEARKIEFSLNGRVDDNRVVRGSHDWIFLNII